MNVSRFFIHFYVFDPFLRSWRPGNASKGILEVIRFICTEYEPVGRHGDPKRIHFHLYKGLLVRVTLALS